MFNVVVSFEEKDAAFSFLASVVEEAGYRGIVTDDMGQEIDRNEYEESDPQ
jgi:hypothetical protein